MDKEILEKWRTSYQSQDSILFGGFFSLNDESIKENFVLSLEIINGTIEAKIGIGTSLLNEYTIVSIAQSYSIYLKKNNLKNIFVSHDGTFYGILLSKVFASTLINEKINAYFSYDNMPLNDAISVWIANNSSIKFDGVVAFSQLLNKKNYKISLFNEKGLYLSSNISREINSYIENTNYLNLNIPKENVPFLKDNNIDEYKDFIKISNLDISNISVLMSNTNNINKLILENFFNKNSIKNKTLNLKKDRTYTANSIARRAILKSLNKKSDVLINFLDNNFFEFIIKHKHRKKFLSYNELSLIYLYYQLNFIKETKNIECKKIFVSNDTNNFIEYYAGTKSIKCLKINSIYSEFIESNNKNILFATNGKNYFITDKNQTLCSDPLLNIKIFLELVSFFKRKGKTLYDVLVEIYQNEQKYYRHNVIEESMDVETVGRFFLCLENTKKLNNQKIIRIKKSTDQTKAMQIILEDKTSVVLEYNKNEKKLRTVFSIWSNNNNNNVIRKYEDKFFVELVVKEKNYINSLNELKENNWNVAKFSWKSFTKYSIFVTLLSLLFFFTFKFILDSDFQLFTQIKELLKADKFFAYMLPAFIFIVIFPILINCWSVKRMMILLDEKVKIKHIIISQIIGICLSIITPMVYGGESVGYWYLRRKGVQRPSIAAMYLVQSLLFQITIVLFSLTFVPLAFIIFLPNLLNNNPNSITILILIFFGIVFDMFASLMISLLTFNKRMQFFIVKNLNKFIEWVPFFVTRDSVSRGAKLQYEFTNINKAAKKIFGSHVWYINILLVLEMLSYRILVRLIDVSVIMALAGNMLKQNNIKGYFYMIAGWALIRAINALNFVIPDGLGIVDWSVKSILVAIFVDGANVADINSFKNINVYQTLNRVLFTISWLIISAFLLMTVYIGEFRIDKYKRIKKTLSEEEIKLGNIKTKTTFYKQSICYWIICLFGIISAWYLIYNYFIK